MVGLRLRQVDEHGVLGGVQRAVVDGLPPDVDVATQPCLVVHGREPRGAGLRRRRQGLAAAGAVGGLAAATFAVLLLGSRGPAVEQPTFTHSGPTSSTYESSFLWNGYRVALTMWPDPRNPHGRCLAATLGSLGDQTCVRVSGGWAVHDRTMTDTDLNRWVSVFRDNGWRVWVLIYNSDAEKGSTSAGPPPLDVADLERVATSDLWFR